MNVIRCAPPVALAIGLGCRRDCPADHLAALLDDVLARHALQGLPIAALATVELKADEPGLLQLAARLGCVLHAFDGEALGAHHARLSQRSVRVFELTGCYGVAESAALALAQRLGQHEPQLLVTRQTSEMASIAICAT